MIGVIAYHRTFDDMMNFSTNPDFMREIDPKYKGGNILSKSFNNTTIETILFSNSIDKFNDEGKV